MPRSNHARQLLALSLAAALLAALVLLRRPLSEQIAALAGWVDGLGWMAPVAFVAIYAGAVPLLAPAAPFLLAGGILFGPLPGTLYGLAGTLVGGAAAFALGRYLLRERIERKLGSVSGFAAAREALRREGLRGAALIRFSPVLPAWLIHYALGVSPLGWRRYLLSSVAAVPTVALYSLSGAGLGNLAALERGEEPAPSAAHVALLLAGIVATLVATALLARRARRIFTELEDG